MPENAAQIPPSPVPSPRPLLTLAVASGKGGVGKTNVSVNLGVAAAMDGRRVLILDADMGLANVDILLGLYPERNLTDVMSGDCELDDIIVTGPEGVSIIPSGSGIAELTRMEETARAQLISSFASISQPVDLLIVDTQAGVSDNVSVFSRAAQEVLVVVCDEPTAIADAYALTKVLHNEHGIDRFQVVANMVQNPAHGHRLFKAFSDVVDRFLDVELGLVGIIPRDDYLLKAVRAQSPVVKQHPMSKSALAFRKLARDVCSLRRGPGITGHIQFFVERLATG